MKETEIEIRKNLKYLMIQIKPNIEHNKNKSEHSKTLFATFNFQMHQSKLSQPHESIFK